MPVRGVIPYSPAPHLSDEAEIIEAFQERRRAFQARWNAHVVALMLEKRRCPRCEAPQPPNIQFPYRQCGGCGAQLSHGIKDST